MAIDVETQGSPGWWMTRLDAARVARIEGYRWSVLAEDRSGRRPPLKLLADHLRGDPPLSRASQGWAPGMREFLRLARMNYAELVVDSVTERMVPLGWHTAVDSDFDGDREAARIARANDLDLVCADVFGHMLGLADGYAIVGPPDRETEVPRITAEDPHQVITADDPASGRAVAALKVFVDEWTADEFVYVYVPGHVYVTKRGTSSSPDGMDWDDDLSGPLPPAFRDVVPVIRFKNRRGIGEFEAHLSVLDRINDTIFDRVVIGKYQAHRQRAVRNLPEEDEQGRKIDYRGQFLSDPGEMWKVPEGVDFWESQPIDLGPLRLATIDDVKGLAAVTRTPLHWITPDAAQGSAEGASLQRESSTTKVEDRRRRGNRGLSRMLALAFRFMGDAARSNPMDIVTIWQPAERSSLAERYDAAVKAKSIGMPFTAIGQHILQLSPDDIARVEAQRAGELLLQPPAPGEAEDALAAAGLGPNRQIGDQAGQQDGGAADAGTAA